MLDAPLLTTTMSGLPSLFTSPVTSQPGRWRRFKREVLRCSSRKSSVAKTGLYGDAIACLIDVYQIQVSVGVGIDGNDAAWTGGSCIVRERAETDGPLSNGT